MLRKHVPRYRSDLALQGEMLALTGLSSDASRQREDAMGKKTGSARRRMLAILAAKRRRLAILAAKQYSERLHAFISRYVQNPDDVEDIKQNTYLKFIRSVREKYNDENVGVFLFRIAKCQIAEYWVRKNKDDARFVSTDDVERWLEQDMAANSVIYSAKAEHEENMQRVIAETKGMSQMMSSCLLLQQEGMSSREISETLGIKEATVRKNISRGRKLIVKKLQE